MFRSLGAVAIGSVVNVVLFLVIAWPITIVVGLSGAELKSSLRFWGFIANCSVSALTAFGSGYLAAAIAGANGVRQGVLSASLCIVLGVFLIGQSLAYAIPLFVISPVFGAIGGGLWERRR